ncbi:protein-glutamate methylesterase/protein-glutamine glutaminase [Amantichitinum ursilacus]|uniref:Protein-glutamate methylesterase/protein-glutamine glutaminase n=1 Tax=Amantichitinum ursilacus TaxID=857265 RepID=A0A0N0XL16_9NEIS|nr:chemotaxis response regulator protein-glutamate methylesterase [Amantichitinum ursilacus]KPC55103.1 Chemotaxis response regulator protein-glutamate methylesterase [Amantichitinum ursilacus]
MAIKVMIVDDSAVVRQVMQETLSKAADIQIIGTAPDPIFARQKMEREWPDVIVLDIEMPRMDGLTFLRQLMAERPTPVVICSSLTEKGAETTMQALASGALGIITKPSIGVRDFIQDSASDLIQAVRAAAAARLGRIRAAPTANQVPTSAANLAAKRASSEAALHGERMNAPKLTADAILDAPGSGAMIQTTERIVAIGTSTGGTQALEEILTAMGSHSPAIAIVQHMPEKFTSSFAARLNGLSKLEVKEAQNNDRMRPGRALIAPGGKHMLVKRSGAQYYVEVIDGPLVSRHRPSVDVLFRSVAKSAGRNAVGFIMTGMGDDGAHGLKEMHDAGARTFAQDENTCVVFGMPKEAIKLGGVDDIVPLDRIAGLITGYATK